MAAEPSVLDDPPSLAAGDVIDGRYRIVRQLARGGMGTVFLAEHVRIKRRLALKILHRRYAADEAMVGRFMTEALAAGTLGHPNIVESIDMGFTDNRVPFIVFEYLDGTQLIDEIQRLAGLPVRRALRIASQIAAALDAAHAAGIVHLDLKSDNVLLLEHDRVKVLDFGIARFLENTLENTEPGLVIGTPDVMAPEQITSPDRVDRRADMYALGVLLYEMLSGRRPFENDSAQVLLYRSIHEPPPPLEREDVPVELARLIFGRMLAKDRERRVDSMRAVKTALDMIERDLGEDEPSAALEAREIAELVAPRPIRSALRALPLIAAIVGALAGTVLLYAEHRVESSTDTAALAALDVDADKIATLLASEARLVRMRTEQLSATPLVRAALETDAATVADLAASDDLLAPHAGETIEAFQAKGTQLVSLHRAPAGASPLVPDPGHVRLASDGTRLFVTATAPVMRASHGGAPQAAGAIAVAATVDLALIERLVREDARSASLTGAGAPIVLAHAREVPGATTVTIPIALDGDLASPRDRLALVATTAPTSRGATLSLAARVSFAFAFALLVIYVAASRATRRPA